MWIFAGHLYIPLGHLSVVTQAQLVACRITNSLDNSFILFEFFFPVVLRQKAASFAVLSYLKFSD